MLIEKYVFRAILPYILLSILLLTAILFIQQIGRFGELLLGSRVPLATMLDLALSILPNVLIFTLPMALLSGIIIGFSRMGSDSELVALRAAGVGTWKLLKIPLFVGIILTLASLHVNLTMVPEAARSLRQAGSRAALYKLESPVEPRSFNTDIPKYVIYVRDGIKSEGLWGRVFLFNEEGDGNSRIVTARSGRIDSKGVESELVLSDATLITLPQNEETGGSYITERLAQLRITLDTGRKAILEKLEKEETEQKPNEMGLQDLYRYARARPGPDGREARILMHKRLAISFAPLFFALLGSALGLRIRKGGRGAGMLLSLLVLLAYYLLTLAGEQMARAGSISPILGGWLASSATLCVGFFLLAKNRKGLSIVKKGVTTLSGAGEGVYIKPHRGRTQTRVRLLNFPSLMDLGILRLSTQYFALILFALTALLLIFTLFELWRFVISNGIRFSTVGQYLLFLMPMVGVQLLPASTLIALLATYAVTARRNEVIAWGAGGQSIYRLMLPGLVFGLIVSFTLWYVQERVMPEANVRQDELRAQIRGVSRATSNVFKQWLASARSNRLYSYEYAEPGVFSNLTVYDFDGEGIHLRRILKGKSARLPGNSTLEVRGVKSLTLEDSGINIESLDALNLAEVEQESAFRPTPDKPSHLSAKALSNYIKAADSRGADTLVASVALQKKYANPFGVLVLSMTGIPLALSFGRKSTIIALGLAIALSLIFWGASSGFQQLGEYGHLPPLVAAWSPIFIFTALGIYLLSRTRT